MGLDARSNFGYESHENHCRKKEIKYLLTCKVFVNLGHVNPNHKCLKKEGANLYETGKIFLKRSFQDLFLGATVFKDRVGTCPCVLSD